MLKVYEKLMKVQYELKAPKGQRNTFGNYNFRSCEDITEAVKPLLHKHNAILLMHDDILFVEGRYYVRATVKFVDVESGEVVEVSSNARECQVKKGMDESQITGATSSYARKYALNGLFAIDDTKDADSMDNTEEKVIDQSKIKVLYTKANGQNDLAKQILNKYGYKSSTQVTVKDFKAICDEIEEAVKNVSNDSGQAKNT